MLESFWLTWDYFVNHSGSYLMAYVEGPFDWIPTFNVQYYMGVDGISVPMLFLTGLLSCISIVASFNIENRVKEYFAFFLLLEAARQLRGESTAQVDGASLAVAHGSGGMLGSRHCAGTIVLGRD